MRMPRSRRVIIAANFLAAVVMMSGIGLIIISFNALGSTVDEGYADYVATGRGDEILSDSSAYNAHIADLIDPLLIAAVMGTVGVCASTAWFIKQMRSRQ